MRKYLKNGENWADVFSEAKESKHVHDIADCPLCGARGHLNVCIEGMNLEPPIFPIWYAVQCLKCHYSAGKKRQIHLAVKAWNKLAEHISSATCAN